MPTLQFPQLDRDKYKGRMKFAVWQTIPPNISKRTQRKIKESLQSSDTVLNGGNNNTSLDPRLQNQRGFTPGGNEPTFIGKTQELPTGDYCSIYLPQSIQITDGVAIENVDLGVFGASLAGTIGQGTAPLEALINETGQAFNSMADFFRGNLTQDAARAAAARLAGMGGDTISSAVRTALRTTPAPNTRALFKSVNLREFSFTFNMLPKSVEEAREITRIIKFFRSELYPETVRSGPVPIAYKFPNRFKISIEYDNQKIATGILKSYLRNFQTNYNPNNMAFFKDGNFQEVQISMSFVESRTLDKQDIEEGF